MILLLIGFHSIKALFALTHIMMATPPRCTSSSPTYTTLSPPCSVVDPIPFHLDSLIPSTSSPYPAISFATCAVRVASAMVLTFQQPMVVCFFGGYYGAYGLLGFTIILAQRRHYGPSSGTSGLSCIVNVSGFCNMNFFYGAGSLALRLTPNLEG